MSPYRISLEIYEGPVDLLLYFIHRDKLDVLDIPVAQLADEFVAYVETMGADLEELAEFLLMAAILLRWKIRVLLRESIIEEEGEAPQPITLSRILTEFARYKETAAFLEEKREHNLRTYPRGQEIKLEGKGKLAELLESFSLLLEKERPRQPMLVTRDDWTIEAATDWLHDTLFRRKKFLFFAAMRERRSSVFDMLILFMAVLEQMRLRKLRVSQPEPFADFTLEAV